MIYVAYSVCYSYTMTRMRELVLLGNVFRDGYIFPFSSVFVKEEVCAIMGYRYGPYVNMISLPKVRNAHTSPENNFKVLREDIDFLLSSDREGRILGFIHSHPPDNTKEPSDNDISGIKKDLLGGVWHEGKLTMYDSSGILPYRLL